MSTKASQQGFTLIEVLLAVGVSSIALLSFLSAQTFQQQGAAHVQTELSRNMLQLQLQQTLLSPLALQKSMLDPSPGNVALAQCLAPAGASCAQTAAPQGFFLLDVVGNKLAGDPAVPLLYDYTGALCATPSPVCLFQVYTTYTATCPGASPCSDPTVTARYTIRVAPGITPLGKVPLRDINSAAYPLNPVLAGNSSYASWGDPAPNPPCAPGFGTAYTGVAAVAVYGGMIGNSYQGQAGGAPICYGGPAFPTPGGFYWGTGGTKKATVNQVKMPCAVCINGSYTSWGITAPNPPCAAGYTVAYTGYATIPLFTNWVSAEPICMRGNVLPDAGGSFYWSDGVKHDQSDIPCAVCMK